MITSNFDPSKPLRYFRYGRMSDPGQNPRSPDQQFDVIAAELRRSEYRHWVHCGDFRDDGISARYFRKRKGLQQMLQRIRSGVDSVDVILVDVIDRFGRADEAALLQNELLHKQGVLVLTADTHFADPTDRAGRAVRLVQSFCAIDEGHVKARRVLRGKIDAAKQGHWPGGPAPEGYRLVSVLKNEEGGPTTVAYRTLEPDPESADIAREYFRLAHGKGWGGNRTAKHLNQQPDLVARHGPFDASTICRILSNPIYKGDLIFNRRATDVINDRRVSRENAEEDLVVVPGFCEPIIDPKVWDEVQKIRKPRSDAAKRRAKRRHATDKQIQPLDPGLMLKYALSGLVRCGICGASMRINSSGAIGPGGKQYTYRLCPSALDGRCENRLRVPEDWLWKVVVARLRSRLFPPPTPAGGEDSVPDWVPEIVALVQRELEMLQRNEHDERPLLQQSLEDLKKQIAGWTASLSKPDLDDRVRQHLETSLAEAMSRQTDFENQLIALEAADRQTADFFDPADVIQALRRLDEVLASGNPSSTNAELMRHIDSIVVHPDRRVVMRTCRLGVFAGAVEALSRLSGDLGASSVEEHSQSTTKRVGQRRLARRRVVDAVAPHDAGKHAGIDVQDPSRFAGLQDDLFWKDTFEWPENRCWSAEHADEVRRLKEVEGWTQKRIAEHFGKSLPTVREALRRARERTPADPEESEPR